MNPRVNFFFEKPGKWQKEYAKLRAIILNCGLTEELKWGVPCYTFNKRNIILIHGFKEYCAVLFPKGALLRDEEGLLIRQTEQVQSARQIRFTETSQIVKKAAALKAYIFEAIEVEKAGLKVDYKKTADYKIPEEFQHKLNKNKSLKKAFEQLTPGRQRGYLLYFSQPKLSATREARVDKYVAKILGGMGLDD